MNSIEKTTKNHMVMGYSYRRNLGEKLHRNKVVFCCNVSSESWHTCVAQNQGLNLFNWSGAYAGALEIYTLVEAKKNW